MYNVVLVKLLAKFLVFLYLRNSISQIRSGTCNGRMDQGQVKNCL